MGLPHVAYFVNDREFRQYIAHAESVLFIHDAGRGRRTCSRRYVWPPAGRSGRWFAAAMGLINELLDWLIRIKATKSVEVFADELVSRFAIRGAKDEEPTGITAPPAGAEVRPA
jgi:hypothetical protein